MVPNRRAGSPAMCHQPNFLYHTRRTVSIRVRSLSITAQGWRIGFRSKERFPSGERRPYPTRI